METFRSRDELIDAYRRLLDLEKRAGELLTEEGDPETLQGVFDRQDELMEAIESSEELDRKVRDAPDSPVEEILERFQSLREDNRERLRQRRSALQSQLDSLDQSLQVMRRYMQGDRRSGGSTSFRVDKRI